VLLVGVVVVSSFATSFTGCSRGTTQSEPPAEPARPKVAFSPLGEDLYRAVTHRELVKRIEERVPGFSASSILSTMSINGAIDGRPQHLEQVIWTVRDRAVTREAFDAMVPKLFDELDVVVKESAQAYGVGIERAGKQTQSADELPEYEVTYQYQSAGNFG